MVFRGQYFSELGDGQLETGEKNFRRLTRILSGRHPVDDIIVNTGRIQS